MAKAPYSKRGQTQGPSSRTREKIWAALDSGPGTIVEITDRSGLNRATVTQATRYMHGRGDLVNWFSPSSRAAVWGRPDQRPEGAAGSRDELVLGAISRVALPPDSIAERTGLTRDAIDDVMPRLLKQKLVTRSRGFYRAVAPPDER